MALATSSCTVTKCVTGRLLINSVGQKVDPWQPSTASPLLNTSVTRLSVTMVTVWNGGSACQRLDMKIDVRYV